MKRKKGWLPDLEEHCGTFACSVALWPQFADWYEEEGKPLRATGNCINCGAPDDGADECSYCTTSRKT